MKVYIGADHGGFKLKEELKTWLEDKGHEVVDSGNITHDPVDDYPDFASKVAIEVQKDPGSNRGIVICRSGVGVDIVANKFSGIRCGLALSKNQIESARAHDDINILAISSDFMDENDSKEIVEVFLKTEFSSEERQVRRKKKIEALEHR